MWDFVIYTTPSSMEGLPLAVVLRAEGYSVAMALMNERKAEPGVRVEPHPSIILRKRLQKYVGDGMVEKISADELDPRDVRLAIFDFNYGWVYADKLRRAGVEGILSPPWAYELEHNRAKAADFVKQHYPDLYLPEEKDFPKNSADRILQFLHEDEDYWVIKPDSNELSVFVPWGSRDVYLAEAEQYIDECKDELKHTAVQLQRMIHGYEVTAETWYRRGLPVLANVDIELKNQFPGDLPPQTGCAADLIFTIPLDCELRRLLNKPFDRMARQAAFTGIMDANVIFEERTGKPYFLEFCPARFGYNCLYTFLDKLRGGIGEFFEQIIQGGSFSVPPQFGASVRIFDTAHYGNLLHRLEEDEISFRKVTIGASKAWLWDMMLRDGQLWLVGANPNSAIVTASADSAETALSRVKDLARYVRFEGAYWRYDVDATEGLYSILNRLEYVVKRNLLSAHVKRTGVVITAEGERELLEVG